MGFAYNNIDMTKKSRGGSELMAERLEKRIDPKMLEHFQIHVSRVGEVDSSKIQLLQLQDLPGDPASDHLKSGGYNKFERLIFVSNWQMQNYIQYYGIPWYKCCVLTNAIEPVPASLDLKPKDRVNVIYHTTPHRGLELLVPAFIELAKNHEDVHLDVFSSFSIYGWSERDKPYEQLFDMIKEHPKMTYHGAQPNDVVRQALSKSHIFAYPNIWMETSCMALMEAMSAGCLCVHPNYGALYETASQYTWMYQWQDNKQDHLNNFYQMLDGAVKSVHDMSEVLEDTLHGQKMFADRFYNVNIKKHAWEALLKSILIKKKIAFEGEAR
jgi:UDP-glucose:(glucosyl)LPS alpha-1,2-glucosyltransferase